MLVPVFLLFFAASGQADALLKEGLVALQKGQLGQARESLQKAAQADPQNAFVWNSLAEVYLRQKEPQQASAAAEKAEHFAEKTPPVWHALAMYYSEAGDYGRAARLEQRYSQSPNADPGALARAADLYLHAGDPQTAIPLARSAFEKHPSPASEDLLGRALVRTGQQAEGEKHLEAAWTRAKSNPQIGFDFAQALLHREDFARAAEVIGAALEANARDPQLTLALGVARYGQRRFEEAIVAFLRVIEIDPTIDQPYLFLSRLLPQAGAHLDEIAKAYERWAQREPDNAKAQLLLAKALRAKDPHSERASELLVRSTVLDGSDWESRYELGVFWEDKREYAKAAEELRKSIELDSKQPLAHYHLARVYDRLGKPEMAQSEREIHAGLTAAPAKP